MADPEPLPSFARENEESPIVRHEADEPDALVDLLDADVLTSEDRTQIDLAPAKTDLATVGNGDGAVVQRVSDLAWSPVPTRLGGKADAVNKLASVTPGRGRVIRHGMKCKEGSCGVLSTFPELARARTLGDTQ